MTFAPISWQETPQKGPVLTMNILPPSSSSQKIHERVFTVKESTYVRYDVDFGMAIGDPVIALIRRRQIAPEKTAEEQFDRKRRAA